VQVVKELEAVEVAAAIHPRRRIVVLRRDDGYYTFAEQYFFVSEYEGEIIAEGWQTQPPTGIYASAAIAESEGRAAFRAGIACTTEALAAVIERETPYSKFRALDSPSSPAFAGAGSVLLPRKLALASLPRGVSASESGCGWEKERRGTVQRVNANAERATSGEPSPLAGEGGREAAG
jgi:hypothetical protein